MQHLDDTQLVDAVDGRLDAAAAAHAHACEQCQARLSEMRRMLGALAVDVPEPSPLFWDHFPSRVSRAIDTTAVPQPWVTPARLVWGSAAGLVMVALLLLLPPRVMSPAGEGSPSDGAGDSTSTVLNYLEPWPADDDLDADEGWALVRSVAEEIDYEDARQIGVAPRAGSIERAAMELSDGERAELARLIEQELKRTGA
jgi:hypothetical protein